MNNSIIRCILLTALQLHIFIFIANELTHVNQIVRYRDKEATLQNGERKIKSMSHIIQYYIRQLNSI